MVSWPLGRWVGAPTPSWGHLEGSVHHIQGSHHVEREILPVSGMGDSARAGEDPSRGSYLGLLESVAGGQPLPAK